MSQRKTTTSLQDDHPIRSPQTSATTDDDQTKPLPGRHDETDARPPGRTNPLSTFSSRRRCRRRRRVQRYSFSFSEKKEKRPKTFLVVEVVVNIRLQSLRPAICGIWTSDLSRITTWVFFHRVLKDFFLKIFSIGFYLISFLPSISKSCFPPPTPCLNEHDVWWFMIMITWKWPYDNNNVS